MRNLPTCKCANERHISVLTHYYITTLYYYINAFLHCRIKKLTNSSTGKLAYWQIIPLANYFNLPRNAPVPDGMN